MCNIGTFPCLFDGARAYVIDNSRLMMYKFILSHFNDFVIYEAFCQRITCALNIHIYIVFCLFCKS